MDVRLGSFKWSRRALKAVESGAVLRLIAMGWRARRLRRHFPRLMSPTANPAISDLVLLFGFNMVFYQARNYAYVIEIVDRDDKRVEILFTPKGTNATKH